MPAITRYAMECSNRVFVAYSSPTKTDGPFDAGPTCRILSEALGEDVGIGPVQCANCMLEGKPDPEYLNGHIAQGHITFMKMTRLGLLVDKDHTERTIIKFWPLAKDDEQRRKFFVTMLVEFVRLNRLTEAHVLSILDTHAPEIKDEIGARLGNAELQRPTHLELTPAPKKAHQQVEHDLNKIAGGIKLV